MVAENDNNSNEFVNKLSDDVIADIKQTINKTSTFTNFLRVNDKHIELLKDVIEVCTPNGILYVGDMYAIIFIQGYLLSKNYPMPFESLKYTCPKKNGTCFLTVKF